MTPAACTHPEFSAQVKIARVEDVGKFVAEIAIACGVCGEPFRFVGVPAGLSYERPMVSIDGLELNAPIEPEIEKRLHATATYQSMTPPTRH
jgi:hypothetical protein